MIRSPYLLYYKNKGKIMNNNIGHNNPPVDNKITFLTPVEEIEDLVKAQLEEHIKKADNALDVCNRVPKIIESDNIHEKIIALIAELMKINKAIEDDRVAFKKPYLEANKKIDNLFKLNVKDRIITKEITSAMSALKLKLSDYDTKKYNEEKLKQEEELKAIAKLAEKDGIEINQNKITEVKNVKSEFGGTAIKNIVKNWTITDENEIPRKFLSVDHKKIDEAIKNGAIKIKGIKITESVVTSVRRK